MASTSRLIMDYDEMQAELSTLTGLVDTFEETTSQMISSYSKLCEGWESQATEAYLDDYQSLSNNYQQTSEIVKELIKSLNDYISDMQAVDASYASPKVSSSS